MLYRNTIQPIGTKLSNYNTLFQIFPTHALTKLTNKLLHTYACDGLSLKDTAVCVFSVVPQITFVLAAQVELPSENTNQIMDGKLPDKRRLAPCMRYTYMSVMLKVAPTNRRPISGKDGLGRNVLRISIATTTIQNGFIWAFRQRIYGPFTWFRVIAPKLYTVYRNPSRRRIEISIVFK